MGYGGEAVSAVPVIWYTAHEGVDPRDQWDTGLLKLILSDHDGPWLSDFEYVDFDQQWKPFADSRPIVIVPARHHASAEDVEALNAYLALFPGVVLILVGDEEAIFPWREVRHPNLRMWIMMPDPVKHADAQGWAFMFGNGYHHETRSIIHDSMNVWSGSDFPAKTQEWTFTGQVTHARRKQAANGLEKAKQLGRPGTMFGTTGFAQGLQRSDYLATLLDSVTAPAPSGPWSPDTFRFYEALECGAIPIVDATTPHDQLGYWQFVFGADFPFADVHDWGTVGGIIQSHVSYAARRQAEAMAWWIAEKRRMVKRLDADLRAIGNAQDLDDRGCTVLISSSPIPSHPSLAILEETLQTIWTSTKGEPEIIIMLDGVREEQADLADAYAEYVREVCWRSLHHWRNVLPVISRRHLHQVGMTRLTLELVDTPVILFMEHDTPLEPEPIEWPDCISLLEWGALDVLRFHHESEILPDHEHLMIDHDTQMFGTVPLRRTRQWSQRPHLARTDYYRRILADYFTPGAKSFIEDRAHGMVQSSPDHENRIAIYHPAGNIRRSRHTDGRASAPKYDKTQEF